VFDPAGSGLSEHGVHHFHSLLLNAYRDLVGLDAQPYQPPALLSRPRPVPAAEQVAAAPSGA
jgi:hypothetical protein